MSSRPEHWISSEEYLRFERGSETKSEYLDGQVLPMSDASLAHNRIVLNIAATLHGQTRDRGLTVLASDMRVKVPDGRLYAYPDVCVVRGEPVLEDEHVDTLVNPSVLIEVLSPSTERFDRGRKAERYRRIPTLEEYLLVSQSEARIERYRRRGDAEWLFTEAAGTDGPVVLDSIGCTLDLEDVYHRVT